MLLKQSGHQPDRQDDAFPREAVSRARKPALTATRVPASARATPLTPQTTHPTERDLFPSLVPTAPEWTEVAPNPDLPCPRSNSRPTAGRRGLPAGLPVAPRATAETRRNSSSARPAATAARQPLGRRCRCRRRRRAAQPIPRSAAANAAGHRRHRRCRHRRRWPRCDAMLMTCPRGRKTEGGRTGLRTDSLEQPTVLACKYLN